MSLILAFKNNGITRDVAILDADGATITPADSDLLRVRIGREGETPKLEFTSAAPAAHGSSISKGIANRLRLDASDLDFEAGTYTLSLELFDASDSSEWKCVSRQTFSLQEEF